MIFIINVVELKLNNVIKPSADQSTWFFVASVIFGLVRTRRQGGFHLAQDLIVVINHLRDRNVRVTQIVGPDIDK